MDYKKKYKNALGMAEEIIRYYKEHNRGDEAAIEDLEEVFPELAESKDEKVRKALVRFHKSTIDLDGIKGEEILAWLEKQGEKKVPSVDFKAKDWYTSEVDGKIHDMTYNSTDKVEPKFKVGYWVVNNNSGDIFQVTEIKDDEYCLWPLYGEICGYLRIIDVDTDYHLWTIADAKDGDVLIDKSHVGECVFIFKEARPSDIKTDVNNPLAIIGYCGINHIGFTSQLSGLGFGDTVNCTYYPATKEQRDFLFKKMKEAGYQWDAKKKELKLLISNGGDFESNNSKQKSTWSEEDEIGFNDTFWAIQQARTIAKDENDMGNLWYAEDWLKSLKERIDG